MGNEGDGLHHAAAVRAWTSNSTSPSAPVRGEVVHHDIAAGGMQGIGDLAAHPFMDNRIGDHPASLVDFLTTGFELRLHEQDHR